MTRYRLIDGCGTSDIIEADDMSEAKDKARAWTQDGDWGDSGARIGVGIEELDGDDQAVDYDSIEVEIEPDHASLIGAVVSGYDPDRICGDSPEDHDWTGDGEGGCDENPGAYSHGGTVIVIDEHCRRCPLHRTTTYTGSQRNPGDHDTVEYTLLDDDQVAAHRAAGTMDEE